MKPKHLLIFILILTFSHASKLYGQTNHNVTVGPGGNLIFVDATSGTSTTTINVGDTVVWTFETCNHTVTSLNPSFDTGETQFAACGSTFSHTYTSAGTFGYFCTPHAPGMSGIVIVNAVPNFSTNALSFTSIQVGFPGPSKTLTFTNSTSNSLSMSSLAITGDFAQTNNCGTTLAASAFCTITVTFTPTATGPYTGSLTYPSASTVQLSGTIADNNIITTRPARLHPPPGGTALNDIFSPMHVFIALAGLLLLIKFTYPSS